MARDHDLRGVIVVGDGADVALRRGVGDLLGEREVRAEQRGHRPNSHRHCRLHRLAAQLQQPGRGRKVERAGRAQSRIFAEAVPGDEVRGLGELNAAIPGQHREHRDRVRHDRRLRILGQLELVVGPLAHQPEQMLAQRLVDLVEHIA